MKLLAHRGYSAHYPENTMEAFIQAYRRGFDGVETDVHMTKDGKLVLIHDETIDRTSNGSGFIQDYTYKQLQDYSFSYGYPGYYPLPLLEDLLVLIQGKPFVVNIELKTDVIAYPGIEEKVYQLVHELGVEKQIYYSSFSLTSVLKMQKLDPKAYVGYLMEEHYEQKYQELLKHHIRAFHPRYDFLDKQTITTLKRHGIQIASWTIPDFTEYQRLKDLGVDILISNEYLR
ncbi:glycerophosphodiester phosphodiesterase [Allocoprobacillus halotolerans]|uniref:Glycerophosphodiester phosphodiesterase n=1 Tax=Allocoprobacillus halotolerans TaxID=2944914 RepID=A0ABY5I1M0_9FIRM|nr:glycerophosphodiester phosphodiesterase family protein [Allocoprobacillus halotolerans]UTY37892.1 glycerophosphodiester phosphodiesterase [Allocoprobacillus halotolerans]